MYTHFYIWEKYCLHAHNAAALRQNSGRPSSVLRPSISVMRCHRSGRAGTIKSVPRGCTICTPTQSYISPIHTSEPYLITNPTKDCRHMRMKCLRMKHLRMRHQSCVIKLERQRRSTPLNIGKITKIKEYFSVIRIHLYLCPSQVA